MNTQVEENVVNHTQRRRQKNRQQNKSTLQVEQHLIVNQLVGEYSNVKKVTPTVLIELSVKEWNRLHEYSIHVSDIELLKSDSGKNHNQVYYNSIVYGSQIKPHCQYSIVKIPKQYGGNIDCTIINHTRIKTRKVLITTDKDQIGKINKNHILVSSNCSSTNKDSSFKSSNKVVLFCLTSAHTQNNIQKELLDMLSEKDFDSIQKFKPNIIKGESKTNHFQSQG